MQSPDGANSFQTLHNTSVDSGRLYKRVRLCTDVDQRDMHEELSERLKAKGLMFSKHPMLFRGRDDSMTVKECQISKVPRVKGVPI